MLRMAGWPRRLRAGAGRSIRQTRWHSGMGKSGGDKMRSVGQQGGSGEERKKSRRGSGGAVEVERLQAELNSERQRSKALEDMTTRVADRLDAAIESVKAILARQG